jgi:6,7-dimethyl-8-ribityllumazine synthase
MATALSNLSAYNSEAVPDGTPFIIHLVVSQWNESITSSLLDGAITTLLKHKVQESNIKVWNVPGSFELVYGCKKMIETLQLDAVIAIGNVIQGETKHFDFVCNGVTKGIVDLNMKFNTPVIFCVLTDNTKQQSIDRSGGKLGNKGIECAIAAIKMASLS